MAQPSLTLPAANAGASDYLERLSTKGWVHIEGFLEPALTAELKREALRQQEWADAGIGSAGQTNEKIRRDKTVWLNGASAVQAQYLARMEAIRLAVNQAFFAGLFEYEAHFAHYPVGAFYRKHRDALRGSNARVLTSVCYLNPQWCADDGGELVIYNDADTAIEAQIWPVAGDLVLFWSEDFPHEVLPAARDRFSISGWFRRNLDGANPL
ncbi:2OG-Fe(II) oxygenase [Simiduia curdlanivorans]|uniref:2OG-Fe(II) oxygenase n=1 Tax=Simiduia curdlanivorans TaxID=1492769 RepID=A0ABV8V4R3_9GAMM|nr:2OG-Fe(II) oxygenase [Simiduia curdlanivorans]MDN3637261.1 2OG-Fe(II) oxygenase [Simiduia curdlanivorans]